MFAWEAMEKALNAIEMHLFEPLGAQQIAESVGLSAFYFQRLFKRLTGRTLQEYVKQNHFGGCVGLRVFIACKLYAGFSCVFWADPAGIQAHAPGFECLSSAGFVPEIWMRCSGMGSCRAYGA